jgi:hypothetical protein
VAVFGGNPEPFSFPTPTPRSGQPTALQPVDTAAWLKVFGWSPDGKWLAYGSAAGAPAASQAQVPTTLAFYNLGQDKICRVDPDGALQVAWSGQDDITINMASGETLQGRPCALEPSGATAAGLATSTPSHDPGISPAGQYRAETLRDEGAQGRASFTTRLLSSEGSQALVEQNWELAESPDASERFLGGEWISPTSFLIYDTLAQGPLILDVSGKVAPVLEELFEIREIPGRSGQGYKLSVYPFPGMAAMPHYHLLLLGAGADADLPEARLYHGEYDLVETLPFRTLTAVTPDGKWLLMDLNPGGNHAIYFRPLELVEGDWTLLAFDPQGMAWNTGWSEMAYSNGETVTWQDFPDLNLLGEGRWQAIGYHPIFADPTTGVAFSPDGCKLAFTGARQGLQESALFVIDRCP